MLRCADFRQCRKPRARVSALLDLYCRKLHKATYKSGGNDIVKLKNRFTGETLILDVMTREERSLWRLRKRLKDFQNLVYDRGFTVSFLTITQSDVSVDSGYRWITNVMKAMRAQAKRFGSELFYVAVLEIQPKRYRERGVLAPHWHIAIACSMPELLPHAERQPDGRIRKVRNGKLITWDWLLSNIKQKFGMYFCCDAYSSNIYNYLAKYLAKGKELEDFRLKLGRRVRLFSSSRIPVRYQMTVGQSLEHHKLVEDEPEFAELYCRREDARIVFRAKEVKKINLVNDLFVTKVRYPKVRTIHGDWLPTDE